MFPNVSSTAAAETAAEPALAMQLGYVLLAAVATVPPACVARDIVTGRRQLSSVDEILLLRAVVACLVEPYTACFVLVGTTVRHWLTSAQRHLLCTVHSLVVVNALGCVISVNLLISLNRVQQVVAARHPSLSTKLTQRWLRWQNRLLLLLQAGAFSAIVLLGTPPSSYYWCTGLPEPADPPMHLLLSVNSGLNFGIFVCCIFLLRISFGLEGTSRPVNYIPALSWAELCLVIITANALLAPLNIGDFDLEQKVYLNHTLFTLIYGLLDPCLLLFMASRWRQQVRERRLQVAHRKNTRKTNLVIPIIRLDLI